MKVPDQLVIHCRRRMTERQVTESQIRDALKHENSRDAGDGGNIVIRGWTSGRVLAVVLTADLDTVVTVFWEHR